PLGELVETVTQDGLKVPDFITRAVITGAEVVSSYNWIKDASPKIMIPGKPPIWTPPRESPKLSQDTGDYYRDINAASYPPHPLEPAIVSIMKMNPKPLPVNIVACGSTIGNLLRFVGVSTSDKTVRILVEAIGETVHFVRREKSPKELIKDIKGYGHTFPEAYTTWDQTTKRSYSHQRVARYQFGGLDMMVRFEGDGCIETSKRTTDIHPVKLESSQIDNGFQDLFAFTIDSKTLGPARNISELQVVEGGMEVPMDAIFDLKTRSAQYYSDPKVVLEQQIHRLWVSQIKQFIVAKHKQGKFLSQDISIMEIEPDVKRWEQQKQPELMRLAALLHLIVNRARQTEDGKLELVWFPGKPLEIRKQAPGLSDLLSDSVRKDWVAWLAKSKPHVERHGEPDEKDEREISEKDFNADENEALDFSACDRECGYCGRC
ncbi:hypothetical protein BGZ63DRAFT_338166, partial [Mariannaea sp. PMI_226]